ncbi:acyltransferase [Cryobacterium serini]|uniref:Acyltransferase n=2 Tax=Cryobacterium serini TaxID=1259201 RepID=A0A4R9BQ57_9MICO|nr:acyltransferase [Cryobacterium serini]
MVAYHVIGGMQLSSNSGWYYSSDLLVDLRMPLFTALSGFVFAWRSPSDIGSYRRLIIGKARRLLVPLLTVGTLFVLVQSVTPGTNSTRPIQEFWKLYVYGLGHFWFLQAIFLIFLVVGLVNLSALGRKFSFALATLTITSGIAILVNVPAAWDIFSINRAIELLPFFLLGYISSSYGSMLLPARGAVLVLAGALLAVRAAEVFGVINLPASSSALLSLLLGLTGITAVVAFRKQLCWLPLAWLGHFSFAIFLLHVFGTAPVRILLNTIGFDSEILVFVACMAAGLGLPILFEVTLGRFPWISWALLGQKPYRSPIAKPQITGQIESVPAR